MTVKQIKKLAVASYLNGILDAKTVNRVAKILNRAQLKCYVNFLKNLEQSKVVKVIVSSLDAKSKLEKQLKARFPSKKIEFSEDKTLIAGLELIDGDVIYDFNLKNTFENLVSYINH
ncbi:MAG: F0F1 ATP synthase subunit delta [Candidatus Levyibacteriota bacterium]|jgi:F0F1-type ATP synthase delta subunit